VEARAAADAGVKDGATGGEEAEEDSMPIYEYDVRFGVPVRDGDTVTCLHRGSSALDKLLSVPSALSGRTARQPGHTSPTAAVGSRPRGAM
jgi:hypothetical protein